MKQARLLKSTLKHTLQFDGAVGIGVVLLMLALQLYAEVFLR
jgi:hypothetical protein